LWFIQFSDAPKTAAKKGGKGRKAKTVEEAPVEPDNEELSAEEEDGN
jgi:hypothetical protein